ncbi:endoglucanase 20-like [Chenopodium quinoa]|uniref:endoglucanase 20-like n=1 Tax=Chenopodium quinoa TaxID=63459 RepID=UPI000B794FB8|nr:endoglucanase 20-like [Chenopodium quinoa]
MAKLMMMMLMIIVTFFCTFFGCVELVKGQNDKVCNQANSNYKDALGKAILFFEGQRSGKLPASRRVKWRGDSALNDGKSDNVNLVGGYYDAGDNVKFGWPMSFTTTLLSWAAIEHNSEISSAKQIDYLRQAIRWGSDFILKSHTSSTTLYTQVGDGDADHACWERPEDMDTPRTLYKITSSSPGTEAAADASAALAAASIVFKAVDSTYSSKLLQHSQSLFDFADKYRGSYSASCPFYCSYSGYQDELLWAAAWLYKASGNSKYLNYVSSNKGWSQAVSEFSWDNKYAGVQILLAKEFLAGKRMLSDYKSKADSFVCSIVPESGSAQFQTTPGGLLFVRDAANLQYVTSASMIISIYTKALKQANISGVKCGSANLALSKLTAFTKSQVDYILGNNPNKMSYMVGFGSKFPQQVHHRGASIPSIMAQPAKVGCNQGYSSWYNSNKPNPNVHVGAVVGGPDANDQFKDVRSDHTHSEPTTYLNAAFIGSIAPLLSGDHSAECLNLRKTNETSDVAETM